MPSAPRSISLTVSYTQTAQSSTAMSALPALSRGSSRTTSTRSVDTGRASYLGGMQLLDEEEGGALVVPPTQRQTYSHSCTFYFLDCPETFDLFEEWRVHVLSHFRGHAAPTEAGCPLCPWKVAHSTRDRAWSLMLKHVAVDHFQHGHSLATSRPDFALIKFLYNKRILDEPQFKALYIPPATGTYGTQLRTAPSNQPYVMAASRRRDAERQRPMDARAPAPRGSSRPRAEGR